MWLEKQKVFTRSNGKKICIFFWKQLAGKWASTRSYVNTSHWHRFIFSIEIFWILATQGPSKIFEVRVKSEISGLSLNTSFTLLVVPRQSNLFDLQLWPLIFLQPLEFSGFLHSISFESSDHRPIAICLTKRVWHWQHCRGMFLVSNYFYFKRTSSIVNVINVATWITIPIRTLSKNY